MIIADIGSGHRGDWGTALQQIESAKIAGADVAKFQLYSHRELFGLDGHMEYALPHEWLEPLANHCAKNKIGFMCSAFSPEGVKAVDPFVEWHKVASSEALHYEILDAVKATGKPFIVSTGGLNYAEVDWIARTYQPTALLECVANYPADTEHYNLKVFKVWEDFGFELGVSDHTRTNAVSLAAVGLGATIFEKHFDAFKDGSPTPDSDVSLDYAEFAVYASQIRMAQSALGDGIKQPRHQHDAMLRYRRRLIITQDLPKGSKLKSHENYGIFRSLKDDTRGDRTVKLPWYEGKILKVEKKAGDSLWEADVENG